MFFGSKLQDSYHGETRKLESWSLNRSVPGGWRIEMHTRPSAKIFGCHISVSNLRRISACGQVFWGFGPLITRLWSSSASLCSFPSPPLAITKHPVLNACRLHPHRTHKGSLSLRKRAASATDFAFPLFLEPMRLHALNGLDGHKLRLAELCASLVNTSFPQHRLPSKRRHHLDIRDRRFPTDLLIATSESPIRHSGDNSAAGFCSPIVAAKVRASSQADCSESPGGKRGWR